MKMHAFLSAVWGVGLLLALNVVTFRDRTIPLRYRANGTYYPYGISNEEGMAGQGKATGRFSDFMVQSDFVAKLLGLPLSPPASQRTQGTDYCSPAGMNFAFSTTGVFQIDVWINLREQVDYFKKMIKSGTISKNHVTHSVALIASSANDYKHFGVRRNARDNSAFIDKVTTEIATNVERLQNLGVKRILVNNLHPLGCTPSLCRSRNYQVCDDASNRDAAEHNRNLEQKLGNKKGVLIVDLNTAFDNIIGQAEDSESLSYKQFQQRREPCCESFDPKGFCGQQGDNSEPLYTLCADPSKYFFWDEAHPTHAGWEAVMKQLQDPIKEFLGIA